MGRSVRISVLGGEIAPLRRLLDVQTHESGLERLRMRLDSLLSPVRRRVPKVTRRSRKPSKEEKRDARANIRERVFARAGGRCEGPGAQWFGVGAETRCLNGPAELSHMFGRGRGRLPESERTCAAWCRLCHLAYGASRPSAAVWWGFITWWLGHQGFTLEAEKARARRVFVETRASLPAAPRTHP